MSKSDTPHVRKPYKVKDFAEAVERTETQRCQRCEAKLKFNNRSTIPVNNIVHLDAVCGECQHPHRILFNIANIVVHEA